MVQPSTMETILSSQSLFPLSNHKASSPTPSLSPSLQPRSNSLFLPKPITSSLKKHSSQSLKPSLATTTTTTSWFSYAQQGLAALALSLALNFSPVLLSSGTALASEFDVLNDGPPKESYVVDDAGVISRVTKSDLKRLLSDLESRKNFRINFITVRKLTVSFFSTVSIFIFWYECVNLALHFSCDFLFFPLKTPFSWWDIYKDLYQQKDDVLLGMWYYKIVVLIMWKCTYILRL